jgi:hypothetical protein
MIDERTVLVGDGTVLINSLAVERERQGLASAYSNEVLPVPADEHNGMDVVWGDSGCQADVLVIMTSGNSSAMASHLVDKVVHGPKRGGDMLFEPKVYELAERGYGQANTIMLVGELSEVLAENISGEGAVNTGPERSVEMMRSVKAQKAAGEEDLGRADVDELLEYVAREKGRGCGWNVFV